MTGEQADSSWAVGYRRGILVGGVGFVVAFGVLYNCHPRKRNIYRAMLPLMILSSTMT